MLNKLLKYEFKATSRYLLPLYILLVFVSIINKIILSFDVFHGALLIVPILIKTTYFVSLISVIIVTMALMVIRFYKNLMGDEGYLMFTLPVTSNQLINSKLLIATFWTIISIIIAFLSIMLFVSDSFSFNDLMKLFKVFYQDLELQFGNLTTLFIVELIIMMFLGLIQNILLLYVSIAVGQLVTSHKLAGSFGAYMGISTATQIVLSIILIAGGFIYKSSLSETVAVTNIVFPVSIILTLATNFLYYIGTSYIIKNKLNLD